MSDPVRRKLTTIFCADVHGYSRLMDIDEVSTLQTLKLYRQAMTGLIERHDGRVFAIAGDSVAAEFGSVVEAVQCAAEVQRELRTRNDSRPHDRRLEFRIGINLGDVMVEGDDLYGEGVNIAARLEGLAEPGGICISGTVYDQVHNKLTLGYDFMGEQTVKNISQPVPAYSIDLSPTTAKTQHATRPHPRAAVEDTASDDQKRWFRHRTARLVFVLAILFVINAATTSGPWTEPGTWWALWFALLFAILILWRALNTYRPDLVGRDAKVGGDMSHSKVGSRKVRGDMTFSKDTEFHGKIRGNVKVARGVSVKLFCKIGGNLIIEPDAVVELHGVVGLDVINRGGAFRLHGKVRGSERHEVAGQPAPPPPEGERPVPRFLKIEGRATGKDGKDEGFHLRVPLHLLRAGIKMRALIPEAKRDKINEKLRDKGIEGDIFEMSDHQIDTLIRSLGELELEAGDGDGSFRIYLE